MSPILQGDLRFFPAARLLPFLVDNEQSGTLVLSVGDRHARVVLHQGKIAWLEGEEQALGVDEALVGVLQWREGTFALEEDASLPSGRQSLDLDLEPLLEESHRRQRELRRILDLYPDDRVTFRVADPSDQISLKPAEFKLLLRLGVGDTLAELCRNLGRAPAEVYPLIHNLEANGLVAVQPVAGGEATTIARTSVPQGMAPSSPQPHSPASGEETFPQSAPPASGPQVAAPQPPARPEPPPSKREAPALPAPLSAMPEGTTRIPSLAIPRASLREPSLESQQKPAAPAEDTPRLPERPVSMKTLVGSLSAEAGSGAMHPLMSDEVIVGRDAGNGVSIQDGSVSTRHARITRTPEGFVLEDLKSRNGTFVNGEPVKEKRLLVDNDLIRFGRVVLTFNTAREIAPGERTIIEKIP
jgi:FHA domain/Domain of unknown function (DUF4388)